MARGSWPVSWPVLPAGAIAARWDGSAASSNHARGCGNPAANQLDRHRSCDTARMETTETAPHNHEPRIGRSVSLDHAAQILGVSRRTIYNRIREGRLQTIRTLGGSQRVLLDSVQEIRSQ